MPAAVQCSWVGRHGAVRLRARRDQTWGSGGLVPGASSRRGVDYRTLILVNLKKTSNRVSYFCLNADMQGNGLVNEKVNSCQTDSVLTFMCFLKELGCVYDLSHSLHRYGLSDVWTCMCFFRSLLLAKRLSQPSNSHMNGFSPEKEGFFYYYFV